MSVSRALRRLLRIRDLEEEQARLALEAAIGDHQRLQQGLDTARDRQRGGRTLVSSSARSGQLPDRLAGLEETRAGSRLAAVLTPRLAQTDQRVLALREEYLAARVERRQAQTLIEEAEAAASLEQDRRSQQGLDDWFGNRRHRSAQGAAEAVDGGGAGTRGGPEAGTGAVGSSPAGVSSSAEGEDT